MTKLIKEKTTQANEMVLIINISGTIPPPRIARYTTVYFGRFHSDASQRQDIYSAREVKYLSKPCFKIQDARTRLLWPDERTAPIDSKRGRWSRRRSPVCCKEVFSSRRSIGFLSQLPSSSFTDR